MRGVDVSVCIVTFQVRDLLHDCLISLYESIKLNFEIIIADNGSTDGTSKMIAGEYPDVHFIANQINAGYTRPMNQALRMGRGRFLLQLNPDTLMLPGALDLLVEFLDSNPKIGICGQKVLNPDRSLQKPCRRGESRPWAVITYFTGLAALFPKSKFFGQYLMSYRDEDEIHPVAGVSGSCMIIRREVFEGIGYLDERFFAYQEDADFCFRARQAGWQVYYMPKSEIIHYGSLGGSHVQPYRSIIAWHKSYYLFYQKNFARDYFFIFNWLYYLAMVIKLVITLMTRFFKYELFSWTRKLNTSAAPNGSGKSTGMKNEGTG